MFNFISFGISHRVIETAQSNSRKQNICVSSNYRKTLQGNFNSFRLFATEQKFIKIKIKKLLVGCKIVKFSLKDGYTKAPMNIESQTETKK